jgi:uncharacterized protein (DUF3084 family)
MAKMRLYSTVVFLVTAALAIPLTSSAQSLAEAAAKEKERRKARSGHVFTEEDLRKAGGGRRDAPAQPAAEPGAPVTADEASTGSDEAPKAKTEEEARAEQEKAWRERLSKAQADVARLTAEAEGLQRALNNVSQNIYSATRTAQLNRLEETKKQLATAQQSVAELEAEGRRSRFNP